MTRACTGHAESSRPLAVIATASHGTATLRGSITTPPVVDGPGSDLMLTRSPNRSGSATTSRYWARSHRHRGHRHGQTAVPNSASHAAFPSGLSRSRHTMIMTTTTFASDMTAPTRREATGRSARVERSRASKRPLRPVAGESTETMIHAAAVTAARRAAHRRRHQPRLATRPQRRSVMRFFRKPKRQMRRSRPTTDTGSSR